MIPAQFDYLAPTSVEDALAALAEHGDDAKIIAGGQSLLPVLRMRLNAPETVIDLGKIDSLRGIRDEGDVLAVGAMTTHHEMLTNDLVKETRADLSKNRRPALYWLSAAIAAARAYGLDALDGVYNNFKDAEGFRRECVHGRALGFDGKTLIHPDQIAVANEVFAPPEAEVAWARRIIAAFDLAEHKGKGVITVEGRMVELMHAEMARRTVAIAEAIAGNAPQT